MLLVLMAAAFPGAAHAQAGPSSQLVAGHSFDSSRGTFIEGFRNYFRLTQGSAVVLEEQANGFNRFFAPGRYRLTSYIRSCSGTCNVLDAPSTRCSRRVTLPRRRRVTGHVRRNAERCFIVLSSDERAAARTAARLAVRKLGGLVRAGCRRRTFQWRCRARNSRCRATVRLTGVPGSFRAGRLRTRCS